MAHRLPELPQRARRYGRFTEYRALGQAGPRVSVLAMGTMTFGGTGPFANVGTTDVSEARRPVDMCLDAGVNLIDTADACSGGRAGQILGRVPRGRRDQVLVAARVQMPMGCGPNDAGLSRNHVISGCDASLRRLAAAWLTLTEAERAGLDKVSAAPLICPYRHQAKTARDRLSPADLILLGPA